MKTFLSGVAAVALAAGVLAASPAQATLQIAFTDGTNVVTCADGQACDLAGPCQQPDHPQRECAGPLAIIGTVAAFTFGTPDSLQLSTSLIQNTGDTLGHLSIVVGDTNFVGPVSAMRRAPR